MKRLLLITLLIGYIYPCVAQDKPISSVISNSLFIRHNF